MAANAHEIHGFEPSDRRYEMVVDRLEKTVDRVAALEKSGATVDVEIRHIAKTLDAMLSWVRWLVVLVLGTVFSGVLSLVLKLPVVG